MITTIVSPSQALKPFFIKLIRLVHHRREQNTTPTSTYRYCHSALKHRASYLGDKLWKCNIQHRKQIMNPMLVYNSHPSKHNVLLSLCRWRLCVIRENIILLDIDFCCTWIMDQIRCAMLLNPKLKYKDVLVDNDYGNDLFIYSGKTDLTPFLLLLIANIKSNKHRGSSLHRLHSLNTDIAKTRLTRCWKTEQKSREQ